MSAMTDGGYIHFRCQNCIGLLDRLPDPPKP